MVDHPNGIAASRFARISNFVRAPCGAEIKDTEVVMAGVPFNPSDVTSLVSVPTVYEFFVL